MIDLEDIRLYLPKYLSPENEAKLLQDLSDFPENIDQRMYGFIGKEECVIYQGDCLNDMLVLNLPDTQIKKTASVILSNTCDIDVKNERRFSTNIIYTPLVKLGSYKNLLATSNLSSDVSINNHIDDIRKQRITQIFYLPSTIDKKEEHIVFLDKICSCDNRIISREDLSKLRLFSLSQYGFYLFLFKLSIHFTRIHEGVDRKY